MNQSRPSKYELLELTFTCNRCCAEPGEWCTTKTDRPSQFLHADRHYQAMSWRHAHPEHARRKQEA